VPNLIEGELRVVSSSCWGSSCSGCGWGFGDFVTAPFGVATIFISFWILDLEEDGDIDEQTDDGVMSGVLIFHLF
jgi:hypothetical protein